MVGSGPPCKPGALPIPGPAARPPPVPVACPIADAVSVDSKLGSATSVATVVATTGCEAGATTVLGLNDLVVFVALCSDGFPPPADGCGVRGRASWKMATDLCGADSSSTRHPMA